MANEPAYYQNALYQIQETPAYTPPTQKVEAPKFIERQVKSVPMPIAYTPSEEQFFLNDSHGRRRPNPDFLREHFLREGRLTGEQALMILRQTTDLLTAEPNILDVKSPVTVVGDIHGQYYDLMKIFEIGGRLSDTNYLFLGDYVDRGCFGIECLLYLYTLKLWYPDRLFLLRGNHECRHLTEYFTFKRECLHKYSQIVYDACIESFNALPIAGLLDGKFFCVHGGISPELNTLDDIRRMNRFEEPKSYGLLCDLLWADPIPQFGNEADPAATLARGLPPLQPGQLWEHNAVRGCSYFFTYEAVIRFLERNELLGVIRGHEAQDAGYVMFRKTPTKKFPSVITVFSAPNYLDVYHNRGAILKYANKNITIRQYHARPHPYWLPNFMDAFTWSLPFVGSKIIEMLLAILSICSQEELEDTDSSGDELDADARNIDLLGPLSANLNDLAGRKEQIKNKILAVGKMQRLFQLLRGIGECTELTPDAELGVGGVSDMGRADALGVQGNQIRRYIKSFDEARKFDIANERLPQFEHAPTSFPFIPVPSMRQPLQAQLARSWHGSGASTPTTAEDDVDGTYGASSSMAAPPGAWPAPLPMEALIKRTLEQDEGDGGVVEMLAERIAHSRKPTGRPRPLKRHETA